MSAGAGSSGLAEVVGTTLTLAGRTNRWTGIDCDTRDDAVVVMAVTTGSPADASGLQRGDVIVAVDGRELDDSANLAELAEHTPAGGKVELTVRRGGAEHRFAVWRPA